MQVRRHGRRWTQSTGRYEHSMLRERRDTALVSQILHELDTITELRRARLAAAEGLVPGVIWPVLFGRCSDDCLYLLLRHGEPAGAGVDDGHASRHHILGTFDSHRH